MRIRRHWLAILGLLIALPLFAADVPPTLEPWKDWVLKDQQWRECPLLAGHAGRQSSDYACTWLGRLNVDAQADGANVALSIRVDARGWVSLPGDAEHWPQQATLGGRPVEVIDFSGPAVLLEKGSYQFRAFIPWQQRPQSLRVPQQIALVTLSVDGKPILPLQRDGEQVTLGRVVGTAPEADSMELRVFRRLDDGLPAQMTTRIELYVSGQAREEIIGAPLPEGFLPMALEDGGWPARLDPDGRLRIQVQAGDQTVTLTARAVAPLASVTVPTIPEPWPAQEVWSYQGDPLQRVTAATAPISIDPAQAGVPDEWQGLPAFALKEGEVLQIEERSRGAAEAANRLTLQREAWLDFDGQGWFARDLIRGTMQRDWRLDVAEPFRLQRADNRLDEQRPGMLVTQGSAPELTGVEWRTPNVQLAASVRIEPSGLERPVAGWQQTFDRIDSTLHLPNGYRLIAAPGSDRADGSWIERWTLLDVFIGAIAVLLAFALLGFGGGALALVYLLLGYHEFGSPLGLLIAALVLALLARVMPAGRLARLTLGLRYVALGLLLLAALPFAVGQLRLALYPQLEGAMVSTDVGGMFDEAIAPRSPPPDPAPVIVEEMSPQSIPAPPPPPPPSPSSADKMSDAFKSRNESKAESSALEYVVVTGSRIRKQNLLDRYDQSTVLQTGSGEAAWTIGSTAKLSWSGPVLADQTVNLLIAPPWLVRSLRLLLVIALSGLLLGIARRLSWRRADFMATPSPSAAALLIIVLLGTLPIAAPVHAQETPSENLLKELRTRLIEPPICAPNCSAAAQATITAQGDNVSVAIDIHALDRVAVALPTVAAESAATLLGVRVNGAVVDAFGGSAPTTLIALGRGVHRLELDYSVGERFDIAFADRPHRVVFNGSGWQASGISEDRLLGDTVSLVRIGADASSKQPASSQNFAPFVRVERRISLTLDWSVYTRVVRLAPRTGGFTVPVPIMEGERINVAGIKVEAGKVNASIGDGESSMEWVGMLDKGKTLTLTAPALSDRAEVWRVVAIPAWHVEFSGVPESTNSQDDDGDFREFVFHPLPGETLTITVTRPVAVDGATRAIDRVALTTAIGQRAATQTLAFTLRASQGGEQVIGVPDDAEFISLTRDGEALNLRPRAGRLSLPLQPGAQQYELVLRQAQSIGVRVQTPTFDLGLPLANIDFNATLPEDRWLLATWGPGVGPAVLFWGELLLMVVLALLLSRWRASPLRWQSTLLLVLGFSTYAWLPMLLVLVWLVAIDWREKRGAGLHDSAFNVVQVAFAALTLIAMFALVAGIRSGLLGTPDMVIAGSQSYGNTLHWFADRSDAILPQANVISLPIWIYRTAMLLWALWLAWAVTRWLRRAFAAWTNGGIWRAIPRKPKRVKPVLKSAVSSPDDSVE